jgi:hypothetical protein
MKLYIEQYVQMSKWTTLDGNPKSHKKNHKNKNEKENAKKFMKWPFEQIVTLRKR